jgi:imidazolonepropionase-like amidohydrolase
MTPMQAILTATKNAATLLGWEKRIGTLEAGKLADVIAVPGDPLANISAMNETVFVMKNGTVYKGGTAAGS